MLIGLTGGIASGKSLVATILSELGAKIIDADLIAKQFTSPGSTILFEIWEEFGDEVMTPDKTLDREKLGNIVFSSPEKKKKLESILHPYIITEIKRKANEFKETDPNTIVVVDVPLLFEVGLDSLFDYVWVVWVDEETQLERLKMRDNLEEKGALDRIRAQMDLDEKAKKADIVINNTGCHDETRKQVEKAWNNLFVN
ncbi:dephospho-CoA kinase [Natranaerofaba carboxydovora]|uniref:dephospho-CoA kinase n=1 Tax=Natranaerofaba carboxydovora TaxID=2742683 RepID=UPI001F142296|nr:dephospho-CoA kinase [Natranaerofaba carboxydovora]UMZ72564.1 Dephospho-CoA kinase [Natranaerofaba carboxydovora]